eukprot:714612-Amphidinium_carterae.2
MAVAASPAVASQFSAGSLHGAHQRCLGATCHDDEIQNSRPLYVNAEQQVLETVNESNARARLSSSPVMPTNSVETLTEPCIPWLSAPTKAWPRDVAVLKCAAGAQFR